MALNRPCSCVRANILSTTREGRSLMGVTSHHPQELKLSKNMTLSRAQLSFTSNLCFIHSLALKEDIWREQREAGVLIILFIDVYTYDLSML